MNAVGHLVLERSIDGLVLCHHPHPLESIRDDKNIEMRLRTAWHIVHVRLIHNLKHSGMKGFGQLGVNAFGHRHDGIVTRRGKKKVGDAEISVPDTQPK